MKTLNELQNELQDLKIAYSKKYLTTNEYSSMYLTLSNQIKNTNTMKNYQLPMLMSIHNNDRVLYNSICGYYTNEQTKLGRNLKQINKDLDQLTCMGTCIITSIISVDNTKEGRKFWIDIEKKYESIYTNN